MVSWLEPKTVDPNRSIAGATLKFRSNKKIHAEGVANEKTPRTLRVNRAIRVLHRNGITTVQTLTSANGAWLPYSDLPLQLRNDPGWNRHEHTAVCEAIAHTLPQASRVHLIPTQRLLDRHAIRNYVRPVPTRPGPAFQKGTFNKYARISHVSAQDAANAYFCHFHTPKKGRHPPAHKAWESDWELGRYYCSAGAVHLRPRP